MPSLDTGLASCTACFAIDDLKPELVSPIASIWSVPVKHLLLPCERPHRGLPAKSNANFKNQPFWWGLRTLQTKKHHQRKTKP